VVFSFEPPFALIIENKIDTHDQRTQLKRYWTILHNRFSMAGSRKALIYITPDGRRPRAQIPVNVRYQCVSYRTDIVEWLRRGLEQASPGFRTTLSQYVDVVANLSPSDEEWDVER
jgi:hypothetical protein